MVEILKKPFEFFNWSCLRQIFYTEIVKKKQQQLTNNLTYTVEQELTL